MGKELIAIKTPINQADFYKCLKETCPDLSAESLCVLMSHWALETGRGTKCMCYNIGNIKAPTSDVGDYCYFQTYERLKKEDADALIETSTLEEPVKRLKDFATNYTLVEFFPKHPGCRFLAYTSLLAGIQDYVRYLKVKFSACWDAVETGDPVAFAHELKEFGYYTAIESVYAKGLSGLWSNYMTLYAQKGT